MEKKAYTAPKTRVHTMMLESIMNQYSLGDGKNGPRVDMSSAMAKGFGGPIIDDEDDDFDDYDF